MRRYGINISYVDTSSFRIYMYSCLLPVLKTMGKGLWIMFLKHLREINEKIQQNML